MKGEKLYLCKDDTLGNTYLIKVNYHLRIFSGGTGSASGACSVNSLKVNFLRDRHKSLKATKPTFLIYPEAASGQLCPTPIKFQFCVAFKSLWALYLNCPKVEKIWKGLGEK